MLNRILRAALVLLLLLPSVVRAQARLLDVEPVYQQTPVWCWAAVGEMVFRYYGVENINPVGNFQCGILALLHPMCNVNCMNCVVPAGSLATMNNMLTGYPRVASHASGTSTFVSTSVLDSPISLSRLQDEIDAGRPVVAGISPSGYTVANVSEHVALIVGYDEDELIVNDPFPFQTQYFAADPYLRAGGDMEQPGQYRIAYRAFVNRLRWRETIYRISCHGDDCQEFAQDDMEDMDDDDEASLEANEGLAATCCTGIGACGFFPGQPPSPLGAACWCATPMGPVHGQVCQP